MPADDKAGSPMRVQEVFHHDSYLVRRKVFKMFGAAFHIYDPNGKLTFYSKQKAFKQNFNPFVLKIKLDYSMDRNRLLDRRLGIAGAVLLCAIEGRQS